MHSEPIGVVEGASRAAKRTQSLQELWRGPGGQPNALRAGRSGEGGNELSQTHLDPGGVVEGARRAAKHTQSQEECRRAGGQPNTLRAWRSGVVYLEGSQTFIARRSGGGKREGSQTHSEPGGVV